MTTLAHHFPRSIRRKLALTRLALRVERLAPILVPILTALAFFTSLSLLDAWLYLDHGYRIAAYAITIFASFFLYVKGINAYQPPHWRETLRRLEDESQLEHRPLDSFIDQLPNGPIGRFEENLFKDQLWQQHLDNMQAMAQKTRSPWPKIRLKAADPYGLRYAAMALLILSGVLAGRDWQARLEAGFSLDSGTPPTAAIIDMWMTPPQYTGLSGRTILTAEPAMAFRQNPTGKALSIPQGSVIEVRAHQTGRRPRISTDISGQAFSGNEQMGYSTQFTLKEGSQLLLNLGAGISRIWPIDVVKDRAPTIAFTDTPKISEQNALEVTYSFSDDYGLDKAKIEINRVGFKNGEKLRLDLPHIHEGSELITRAAYFDLTAHKWAGMTVEGLLYATDALGQYGESDRLSFILPERHFQHPVAQQLINIRKSLFISPERVDGPRRRLQLIAKSPETFDNDLLVYAGVQSAFWRLKWTGEHHDTETVTDLLWSLALKIEDGGLSLGKERMNDALSELQKALEEGNQDLFDQLAGELDQNLNDMMQQLAQMPQNGQSASSQQGDVKTIDMQTIRDMIQQMRDLAAAGKTEEAQKIMEQLKQILSNIQMSQGGSPEDYEKLMEGSKALSNLDGVKEQQEDLNEETLEEKSLEDLRRRAGAPVDTQDMAKRQQQLGNQLNDVEEALKGAGIEKPSGMDEARQHMDEATRALQQGNFEGADQAQKQALENLGKARDQLAKDMSERLARSGNQDSGQDPLGRGTDMSDELDVPDRDDMRDARQILKDLREKLADPNRTEEERAYLKRLIRRFDKKP